MDRVFIFTECNVIQRNVKFAKSLTILQTAFSGV